MKKAFFIVIVIILLVVINNLIHSIYDIWSKQDLLNQAQKQLSQEELKNQKLKASLSYVQTPQFVEQEARNKLFLVKPGEQDVLVSSSPTSQPQKQEKVKVNNWQKWVDLFF